MKNSGVEHGLRATVMWCCVVLLGAVALELGWSETTMAEEIDNAPGSMCVGTDTALSPTSRGYLENRTSSLQTAVCPTERLAVGGAFTTNFRARIWVSDQHSSFNTCCSALVVEPGGNWVESEWVCTDGKTGGKFLETPSITYGYTFAHYMVRCLLPPVEGGKASAIQTFRSYQS